MTRYPVAEIFHSIQGEGHFVGYPMTFIRLAGCSVRDCHIRAECDTDYKMRDRMSLADIITRVKELNQGSGIVSITGGEPTDHDIVPLVDALTEWRFRIHMETSGKRPVTGIPIEWLTVSPKTVHYAQRTGHTLKVVVRPEWTWAQVRELDQGTTFFHRYLQPLTGTDGKPVNIPQVVAMVADRENLGARWALSTQSHRFWSVP